MHLSVIGWSFHLDFLQFIEPPRLKENKPKSHASELPADHIPAACFAIPPFALSVEYRAPGRVKQKKKSAED